MFSSFRKWTQREKNRILASQRTRRRKSFGDAARRQLQMEPLEERRLLTVIGPDNFGYYASDEVGGTFEDISGTGTPLGFGDDDSANVALPFTFDFYGANYNDVYINSNGNLTFGSGNIEWVNEDLTLAASVGITEPVIAALWDDWDPDASAASDDVYYQTLGTSGVDQRFVVQWNVLEPYLETGEVTFQAVLHENSEFEFRYLDVVGTTGGHDNGASATVGIRDAEPTAVADGDVLQWSFDSPVINDGQTIKFYTATVDANDNDNDIILRLDPGDPTQLEVEIDGEVTNEYPVATLTHITINAGGGDDVVTVDYSNGFFDVDTYINGEGQATAAGDTLRLNGDPGVTSETYDTGPSNAEGNSGLINVTAGPTHAISFTGLEPIEDLVPSPNLTVNDTAVANVMNFVPGPAAVGVDPVTALAGEPTYQVNFGAGPGELINFRNKARLTMFGLGGADAITLNQPTQLGDSLADVYAYGGTGADAITVTTTPAAVSTFVRGQDDEDTIDVTDANGPLLDVEGGSENDTITITDAHTVDLTVNGDSGNDTIRHLDSHTVNETNLYGDSGSDYIPVSDSHAGDTNVYGGLGNDTISVFDSNSFITFVNGEDGNDEIRLYATQVFTILYGGADNDTIRVGLGALDDVNGNVLVDGDGGTDQLIVDDFFDGDENVYEVQPDFVRRPTMAPDVLVDYFNIDTLFVQGGQAADKFVAYPSGSTVYNLNGGPPSGPYGTVPGDVLSVNTLNFGGVVAPVNTTGGTVSGPFMDVNFQDFEHLVYPDRFEINDNANNFPDPNVGDQATVLGSLPELVLRNLSIHGPLGGVGGGDDQEFDGEGQDIDFFKWTANRTGKAVVTIMFEHEVGDLELDIFDSAGNLITPAQFIPSNDANDMEQAVIEVVQGENYYVRVQGADGGPAACYVNNYALDIENFAAPVPNLVDLRPADDTGMMDNDDLTSRLLTPAPNTLNIEIEADLTDFENMGVQILTPAQAAAGNVAGAAVEVFIDGVSVGFADEIGGTNSDLYSFTIDTAAAPINNADGVYFVKGAVRIVDDQGNNATGRTLLGAPLVLTLDATAPPPPNIFLLPSSDTGLLDGVTSKMQPAFGGTAEPNSKIFLYANGFLVGETVTNSQGLWEITSEPLADGFYIVQAQSLDLAGNASFLSQILEITIDAEGPQRPTIDLVNAHDTGWSEYDNVTQGDPTNQGTADFRIQGVPGEFLRIKDGDIEIQQNPGVTYEVGTVFNFAGDPIIPADGDLIATINFNNAAMPYAAQGPHPLSTELYDLAANRGHQAEELLVEIDFTDPFDMPIPSIMATSSDTGVIGDNVTSIRQPAIIGVGDANSVVRIYANDGFNIPMLVGTGVVGSDDSDVGLGGFVGDGFGLFEVTLEPLADNDYFLTYEFEDQAGNVTISEFSLDILIDPYEPNDDIDAANHLGSPEWVTVNNITAHEAADVDYFAYTAHSTGKAIFNLHHVASNGGAGDLQLQIQDEFGNVIATANTAGDETIVIPVVGQETYYVVVSGVVFNTVVYDLEIENFPAPVPTDVVLDLNDDSGWSNMDLTTYVEDARLFIQADLTDFDIMGIPILNAAQANAGNVPGAAVQLYINGASVGYANPVFGTTTLFSIELDVLADNLADVGEWDTTNIPVGYGAPVGPDALGWMELLSSAVRIFDGQAATANARQGLSPLTSVNFDNNAPNAALVTIDMITSSDTGKEGFPATYFDNITSKMSPAFQGVAEVNTKLRLYAELLDEFGVPIDVPQIVGETIVGSDLTDGVLGNGLGEWEITVEPLQDGMYNLYADVEDKAGNISELQDLELKITIDSLAPQRPTIDLVGKDVQDSLLDLTGNPAVPFVVPPIPSDTGLSIHDNITYGFNPVPVGGGGQGLTDVQVRISAEPDQMVLIKDGEDVIAMFMMPPAQAVPEPGNFVFYTLTLDEDPHPLSVEVFDQAGNRSHQSEELLVTIDTTPPMTPATPDLLASSDSGMSDTDNVTNVQTPAFTGVAEINTLVRVYAQQIDPNTGLNVGGPQLIGQGLVGSDDSDQEINNDPEDNYNTNMLGIWEVTVEPLVDNVYDIYIELEDIAGNVSENSGELRIEIDTYQPNTPFLDMREADDTGRHNDDNITFDTTPIFYATTHDPNAANHIDLGEGDEYLKYRIYDRREGPVAETLIYDSFVTLAGFTNFLTVTTPALPLAANEWHNLKLEVEDRAGNITEDFLLDVLVDTQAYLGEGDLHPDSDTGIWGYPATMADYYTADKVPSFFGTAEADNIVAVQIDGGPWEGTTVAVPLDGDDAFQPPNSPYQYIEGNWRIDTNFNLADGEHSVVFRFEDVAGNFVDSQAFLMFVDTQGPRITNVTRGHVSEDGVFYDDFVTSVFDPKPSSGVDPLISSIVVHVEDLPPRTANFLMEAIHPDVAVEEGHYEVVGDANGHISILEVVPTFTTMAGQPALATLELVFHKEGPDGILYTDDDEGIPLPDDRYSLWISDSLQDYAGNRLDGESGAAGPFDGADVPAATPPIFPTGDGAHGGDFHARFTVDSVAEIGTWAGGTVWVDTNGNGYWDPENVDYTNRDIGYAIGYTSDDIFAGNFAALVNDPATPQDDRIADGFDKIAAWGYVSGTSFRWLIDTDNDGAVDIDSTQVPGVNGLPVAGNFDGNPVFDNGDEVGLLDGGNDRWWFDRNHDYVAETSIPTNMTGYPIVGDFNNDGYDDLGTWTDDTFQLDLSNVGPTHPNAYAPGISGNYDYQFRFGFVGVRERPIAGDFNGDGYDDIGLWVPDREGVTPREGAEWYVLVSGDLDGDGNVSIVDRIRFDPRIGRNVVDYTPTPFGHDLYQQLGDDFALPIVGNFDPPATPPNGNGEDGNIHFNKDNAYDVNADGNVDSQDLVILVAQQTLFGTKQLFGNALSAPYLDVDVDGWASPSDIAAEVAYMYLRDTANAEAEGESSDSAAEAAAWELAADSVFDSDDDDDGRLMHGQIDELIDELSVGIGESLA